MNIWSVPPLDLRRELRDERRDLLALLRNVSEDEWAAPTACVPWRVKEVALHLLDSDLGWLSCGRDGDMSSLIPMDTGYRRFVEALGQKNQRWVDAVSGLSPRVLMDLLEWSGEQVAAYHDSLQLDGPVNVVWAGGRVPRWLGLGRDFTERWVHQAQIREAVGKPGPMIGTCRRCCQSSSGLTPTSTSRTPARACPSTSILANSFAGI